MDRPRILHVDGYNVVGRALGVISRAGNSIEAAHRVRKAGTSIWRCVPHSKDQYDLHVTKSIDVSV